MTFPSILWEIQVLYIGAVYKACCGKIMTPSQALSQSIKSHVFRRNLHVDGNQRPSGIAQMIHDQAKMHHLCLHKPSNPQSTEKLSLSHS